MYALRRRFAFLVVFTIAVLAFAQAAQAHGTDHQSNRGSVKVDDDDIDDGPANHPHVICGLLFVVEHGVGFPFDIDFDALSPTTRPGHDQRVLIVHVPGGDKHQVIWVQLCPAPAAQTTTTTTAGTTTTVKATTTPTVTGGAVTNTSIPTQVLGENFVKPATDTALGETSLANTGSPFSPALAVGLVFGGLLVLGATRHASGRRLEVAMRRSADRDS